MSEAPSETNVVRVPASSTLGREALALRHEVFVLEQGVPVEEEIDEDDATATHFVAIYEGEIVGTLRVVFRPEHAKIGRVVVRRERRELGIARRMMIFAMEYCKALGVNRFYLTAQVDKLGLYEKLGFVTFGPQFLDAGIPHLAMKTY
ncbi:GNAT family N-acetyltransferase [Bradyrhizobium sp. LHD-71]|uniref:GNAT family N-acetyltransferase n=1 Tax=Bradyrhizobium sp. LHD-71 TaxID=3072141 RepID=UPI00280D8C7D|nr:GNAT family N-acetyltransferase [Bradyrhizobium sp. LHD-71]MDQ8726235.1 GNAT family N-acetyltransferase [Bradyrhizobium sp. LHD-71]